MRILLALLITMSLVTPAYAYIDPNSGGQLFQLLFPMIAALLGMLGIVRKRIQTTCKSIAAAIQRLLFGH